MSTFEVDLVKDSTMQNIAAILAAQGAGQGSHGLQVKSYDDVLSIVRLGLAPQIFSVGDVIEVGRETKVQASLGEHTGITAVSVDEDKFVTAMDEAGEKEYEIIFDGSAWKYGDLPIILADYGLTVTGTAAQGDTIIVVETASTINMVVMDYITDGQTSKGNIKLHDKTKKHGLILQSEKLLYNLQFDEREAFYYAPEGLAAGTYHFTLGAHTWVSGDVGKVFQFTLTKAVPAGGQLVFVQSYNVTLTGGSIRVFASNSSTTVEETVVMSEGSGGTDLGTLDNTVHDNFNSCQRALLGSNRWSTSAMRQHLNSGKVAGSVWAPQTNYDRPPSWVTNTAGFEHGLDPEFIKICADVELLTALNTVCDITPAEGSAGTGFETTVDKFFLPSRPEVFGGSDNASDKGDAWQYYAANSDVPGGSSNANVDSNRIKVNASGSPTYWWLRSPYVGLGGSVRGINPSGNVSSGSANYSNGVAPACVVA